MNVDLSGNIHDAYRRALARAARLREEGRPARAAAVYRRAAGLAEQYAGYAVGRAERSRRMNNARALRALAERLEQGEGSAGTRSVRRAGHEESEELGDRIRALITRTDTSWDQIGGLEQVKRQIKIAFGIAVARKPTGVVIDSVSNVLLYGPPGTGKSLLASACAGGLDASFFSAGASALLSKWFGESPRLASALYREARRRSPSVVFIDELEALFPSRSSATSGAERRLLGALLSEMSGVRAEDDGGTVFTIGATNAPWLMDEAALSRFGRRIYVPLPDAEARRAILRIHLADRGHRLDFPRQRLARAAEGLSGRQIAHLAARAVERMIAEENPDLAEVAACGGRAARSYRLRTRPLSWEDFAEPLAATRPDTSPQMLRRYENW